MNVFSLERVGEDKNCGIHNKKRRSRDSGSEFLIMEWRLETGDWRAQPHRDSELVTVTDGADSIVNSQYQ